MTGNREAGRQYPGNLALDGLGSGPRYALCRGVLSVIAPEIFWVEGKPSKSVANGDSEWTGPASELPVRMIPKRMGLACSELEISFLDS